MSARVVAVKAVGVPTMILASVIAWLKFGNLEFALISAGFALISAIFPKQWLE